MTSIPQPEALRPVSWAGTAVRLLDQNRLPHEEVYVLLADWRDVASAIRDMTVRGAPAIGVAAAYGLALAAKDAPDASFDSDFEAACREMDSARPTAVNLSWGVRRMRAAAKGLSPAEARVRLLDEACAIEREDIEINRAMGHHGATLLRDGDTVLTHCNAGALATAGFGTALGVLRAARELGKTIRLFADETRPRLQGLRLTAWEMMRDGFDVTVIPDGASGSLMKRGLVSAVLVGADRIAANGDAANKIGTYNLAVLAQRHGVPFYAVAPVSTIDASLSDGDAIPIEERSPTEITWISGQSIGPDDVKVWNPAFDVTPAELITAIVTERGVHRPPYLFT